MGQPLVVSAEEMKMLLRRTREHFLESWNLSLPKSAFPVPALKTESRGPICGRHLLVASELLFRNILSC